MTEFDEDLLDMIAIEKVGILLKDETFNYNDLECVVLSDAENCYKEGYKEGYLKAMKEYKNK